MPPKSIFRQPGTQHFQLVHRSQRDPLIHDPEASQHVLKAFIPSNIKKGKSRAELEAILSPSEVAHDQKSRVGEASLYGIYYDDTEYDYMQHLRAVGEQEDGVESVLIEAPTTSKTRGKTKKPISLKDLPAEALPSASELPRNFESQEAIPSSIAGFRPDMNPHLRQVLEALDDEAFVDDALEDDFFEDLVKDGERREDEEFGYEFEEDGIVESGEVREKIMVKDAEEDHSFEARFAKFKKEQNAAPLPSDSDSDLEDNSEGKDTVGGLPQLSVIGGRRRRKGTSDASGYSMSSSSMFRTEALVTLDERFDQVMEKEYAEKNDDYGASDLSGDDSDSAPNLITSRDDFEAMMDDFLDNYELLGRKMKPILPGDSGVDKLNTLRRALGQDERVRTEVFADEDDAEILIPYGEENTNDKWDCETILTTYSNLEHHPRLIRAKDNKPVPKIKLDLRTGLPIVLDHANVKLPTGRRAPIGSISEEEYEGDHPIRETITRPRDESKEDKKVRKQAVKAERQGRRADKKAKKEQFSTEMKHQLKDIANKEKTKMRKL